MNQNALEDLSRTSQAIARELAASSGYLLARLGVAFKVAAVACAEKAGFELYDYSVLAILGEGARETQATIAEALKVDPSRLVALLDSLEGRGLIVRQRDPQDRRRHVVSVTAAGQKELVRLRRVVQQLEDDFLAPLDGAGRDALHELLVRLAEQNDPGCCPLEDEG
jgi:MarR family transcriptional regulator, lower aerobic nicotinate degradation pathway regulator